MIRVQIPLATLVFLTLDFLQIVAMDLSSNINCGNITDDQLDVWTSFEFWCEGVLFSLVGSFGLLGNIFSIIVLASK